jgi:hypothetical protein
MTAPAGDLSDGKRMDGLAWSGTCLLFFVGDPKFISETCMVAK